MIPVAIAAVIAVSIVLWICGCAGVVGLAASRMFRLPWNVRFFWQDSIAGGLLVLLLALGSQVYGPIAFSPMALIGIGAMVPLLRHTLRFFAKR